MRRCLLGLVLLLAAVMGDAQDVPVRDVTQTVFDAAGKAVPRAQVAMSYCVKRVAAFQHAVANDAGVVTWKAVPAVPAIVWGERVLAGVLPADATTVTTPLPPPVPRDKVNVIFSLTDLQSANAVHFMVQEPEVNINSSSTRTRDNYFIKAGVPISITIITLGPVGVAHLENVYVPYPEEKDNAVEFQLATQKGIDAVGHFRLRDGTTVAGVSRMAVLPVNVPGMPPAFYREAAANAGSVRAPAWIVPLPDGRFTLSVPAPGTYRLMIDLYDQTTPADPALLIAVKPGMRDLEVTLPDPLLVLPGGSELFWLTRAAPMSPQRVQVLAFQERMPVFGPQSALLALWYQPAPNALSIKIGTEPMRTLTRRDLRLTVLDEQGNSYGARTPMGMRTNLFALLPLLPTPRGAMTPALMGADSFRARPELMRMRFGAKDTLETPAYACPYLLSGGPEGMYGVPNLEKMSLLRVVEVPAAGSAELVVRTPLTQWAQPDWPTPLPALPNVSIAGRLLDAAGQPLANTKLTITNVYANKVLGDVHYPDRYPKSQAVSVQTDANGAFTVENAPSGLVVATIGEGERWSGWPLDVPATGLTDLVLRKPDRPQQLFIDSTASGFTEAWWVPDHGRPLRIPVRGQYGYSNDLPAQPGRYWLTNTENGSGEAYRYQPGGPRFFSSSDHAPSTPLGLYLPLDPAQGYPGAVTLTGKGEYRSLRVVYYRPVWSLSTLLNSAITQIDDVPPGEYHVTVQTLKGALEGDVTIGETGGSLNLP